MSREANIVIAIKIRYIVQPYDTLPTGRKRIFIFFNSITAKVVFSVLDLISVIVQSESSDSSRVSNGPASFWANSSTWKIAQAFSVGSNVKTFFFGN